MPHTHTHTNTPAHPPTHQHTHTHTHTHLEQLARRAKRGSLAWLPLLPLLARCARGCQFARGRASCSASSREFMLCIRVRQLCLSRAAFFFFGKIVRFFFAPVRARICTCGLTN
jgi:hypothetical protein